MVIAPPIADASFEPDEAEFLSKVQLMTRSRIWGGLFLETLGMATLSHSDALFVVPATIAPPDAEQVRPEQITAPKVKEDEKIETKLL